MTGGKVRYLVVIEKGPTSYGAYLPDLPGCISVGDTEAEVRQMIREAVEFHLDGMRADGDPIPPPTSEADYIDIEIPAAADLPCVATTSA